MITYHEWEEEQGISPASPEAYYAELAWNAGLKAARETMSTNRSVTDVLDKLITEHKA